MSVPAVSAAPLRVKRRTVVYDASQNPAPPPETPEAALARVSAKRQAERAAKLSELAKETRPSLFVVPGNPELDAAVLRLKALEDRRGELRAAVAELSKREAELRSTSRTAAAAALLDASSQGAADDSRVELETTSMDHERAAEALAAVEEALPQQKERLEVAKKAHGKLVLTAARKAQCACVVRLLAELEALSAIQNELGDIDRVARIAGVNLHAVPGFKFPSGDPCKVNSPAWTFIDYLRRTGFGGMPELARYP